MNNSISRIPYRLNSLKFGISSIVFTIYCIFCISGSNSAERNYIQIAIWGLWFLIAMIEDTKNIWNAIANKSTLCLCLFFLYYFITSIFEASVSYTMTYIGVFFLLYSCYIPFLYYKRRGRKSEIMLIALSSLLGWSLFAISAIVFFQINPSAARTLAADFNAFDNLYIGGGYAIAIGSALIFVWLFSLLCEGYLNYKRIRYSCIIFLILLFILLIKTESTTTLLACILGAVYSLMKILRRSNNQWIRTLFGICMVVIIIALLSGGLNSIGSSIVSATDVGADENVILRRFNRIGQKLMLSGTDANSDNYVDERWGLVEQSWNTFCDNPLFGIGHKVGNIYSKLDGAGVGTHSEICDILAQHGLVGGSLFFLYFIITLKRTESRLVNKGYFLTIFILALCNPFRYFHGFYVIFVLMPMVELLIQNKLNKLR